MSFLFDEVVFGPVRSRRLGLSLGINLLPRAKKVCTFNCIYCECGWTQSSQLTDSDLIRRDEIKKILEHNFGELRARKVIPDALTFAGNGEPTLHPEFPEIIEDTLELQQYFFPESRVVVLSNSTTANDKKIFGALLKTDNIMKLDAGSEKMFKLINNPAINISLQEIVSTLINFDGRLTIQTLLLKGEKNGIPFDNTSGEELELWLEHIRKIKPRLVMLYPIDRPAPAGNIEKINPAITEQIACRVRALGIEVKTYG